MTDFRSQIVPASPLRICILSDAFARDFDPTQYLKKYSWEMHFLHKATSIPQVRDLIRKNFDVFINLCDGAWDEDRPGIEVVQALERFGAPFTGASSAFYEPSREMMKRVCRYHGLSAPMDVFATTPADVERAAGTLHFPLIVKHPNSYNSVGLTRASRVTNPQDLHKQAEIMFAAYNGTLIEEFIEGREFTVLVAENPADSYDPVTYLPIEFLFPAGESFKHYEMKMINFSQMEAVPCQDTALAERLKNMAKQVFVGLDGAGYGRCDIRVNADGEPYLLEINPNPAVFYPVKGEYGSADFVLMYDPAGHQGFLDQILSAALARHKRRRKNWEVRFDREKGYGLYAARPLEPAEVVDPLEERPHYLVSKRHVDRHWSPALQDVFARYAYPLSDEIWVMWSNDPNDWKPINHSCDPNAWLDGLNVTARRRIAAGEEITLDYATFCNETMLEFPCACGSVNCRKTIRGTDYREPFIAAYGEHVSDYVRTKRMHDNT